MKNKNLILVVTAVATTSAFALPVYADAISPEIKDKGTVYSKQKPNTSFYGNGIAGRATEAMTLRFDIERMLQDGEYDDAIPKARMACQLDPGDPECHLLLARAMTKKFYASEGAINEKLLKECLYEWLLLWHHDADQTEQLEAKMNAKRMLKIARAIDKKNQAEFQAKLAAKQQLAKQREKESKGM
jgi:hypothetical protein